MNTKNKIFSKIVLASLIFNLLTPFLFSNNSYAAPETGVIDNLTNVKKTRGDEKNYVEGEVIVKYRKISRQKMSLKTASLQSLGYEIKSENNSKGIANIKSETKKTSEIISELKNDKEVEYVQPNYIYELQSLDQFNDTYKDNLWGLYNFGQSIEGSGGTIGSDISWDDAVKVFSGSTTTTTGTIVAVLDTGVAYNHPDLVSNMWDGTNCLDKDGNALGGCIHGYDFDSNDKDPMVSYETHGTHVAGTIAATINNSKGIMGVNPNAKIMALKIQNFTTQEIVDAINFAKFNGAKVINASFGGYNFIDQSMYDAMKDFQDNGGLFIAAAGNSTKNHNLGGLNRMFPAGYGVDNPYGTGQTTLTGLTNIISVAAIDNNDDLASFSDYGSNTVNIGAPGVSILSTIQGTGISLYNQDFSLEYSTGNLYDFSTGGTAIINNFGANYGINGIWGDINYPFGTGYNLSTSSSFIEKNVDISNTKTPILSFNIWCDASKGDSQNYTDYMALTFSTGGTSYLIDRIDFWKQELANVSTIEGKTGAYGRLTYDLSDYKSQNFNFRFYWVSDANESTDLGCMIYGTPTSPIKVTDFNDDGSEETYGYLDGTSMATPHVAGLASLAWGYRPDLSSSDIKNAILNNGDYVASLSGKTITGKKINAYKTLLSLSQVSNISNIKVYEDETKQVEISTGTTIASPYVEWSDNNNPFTLSGYVFDVKDSLGNSVYSGTTTNNYFTGFTLTKSGDYNFSVYNELLGGQVGGVITTENIHFNLNPNGDLIFSSGSYTNTGTIELSFTTSKISNYTISGDILNTLTGTTSSGETLNVDLTAGDGVKNISISLEDQDTNITTITGSVVLDTTLPVISEVNVNDGDRFATGSLTLTGLITDDNIDTLKINNENVTLSGGYFTKNVSLNAGDNTINFEVSDLAGNTTTTSRNVIRIGKAPTITATNSFGNINFNLSKEFSGTGVILYGTGLLNNTLTGTYGTGETLSISALSNTTYYFKAYFINNGYESLVSNTGSIETPKIIDENTTGNQTVTGSTTIGNATSTGVVFTQTGTLSVKAADSENTIVLNLAGLQILTQSGTWDGVINPPTPATTTGSISLNGYERLNLTFKAGSDVDSLTFSGGQVQVSINVGSSYNGKTFKVYRSGDNQQTFEYVDECLVSNSICTFETSKFSHFTFLNPVSSSSSSGGGGGGGGRGFVATCTAIQLECVDGKYQIVKGQKCTSSKVGKACEASNYVNTMTSEAPTTKTNITKKEVSYNGYSYTKYEGDAFSAKIDKVVKSIIAFDKVDDNVKEAFIINLDNFQNARYELLNASEKTDVLKNRYRKYSIILRASIKKLNENIRENTLEEKNTKKITSKQETKIVTENKVIEVQKETYKVKSYSVKLYLDSSFKTLTAWVKTGDEVELVEDLGKVVKVKITKSYAERYVGKVGYIYKSHLEKK